MPILKFTLTMPNNNAWNGQWSGAGTEYNIVKDLGRSKAAADKADKLLNHKTWYHSFGDGWGANVSVELISAKEAEKARKMSAGFCGYDWMVASILKNGSIRQ